MLIKKNMRISNKKKNDVNNLNNKEVDEVWIFFYFVDIMDMIEGMEINVKKRLEYIRSVFLFLNNVWKVI